MAVVGSAAISVFPSFRGFKGAVSKEVQSTGKSSGGLFSSAFAGAIGGGVALIGATVASGLGKAISEGIAGAADLEQSIGAIQTIFKGSAAQMLGWSETAATSVGLTKNEFNELGSLIGAQLKNGGTAMDELGPKTNDLITLGADLSSMFGGSTKEAVEALSSALKGERDPIERYGVSLNQAKIDAEAAALGFEKVGGALSAEAQQAATLSLIMKQTNDAHGNFSKEADTISGKQQRLNALWKDGETQIAGAFLPALSSIAEVALKALPPVLKVVEGISKSLGSDLAGAAKQLEPAMRQVVAAIGPMAQQLSTHLSAIGGQFQAAFAGQDTGKLLADLKPFGAAIVGLFGSISQAVQAVLPMILQIGRGLADTFQENLPAITSAVQSIGSIVTSLGQIITQVWTAIGPVVLPIVQSIFGTIVQVVSGAAGLIASLLKGVSLVLSGDFVGAFNNSLESLKYWEQIGKAIFANIANQASVMASAVVKQMTGIDVDGTRALEQFPQNIGRIWERLKALTVAAFNALRDTVNTALATAASTVRNAASGIVGTFSSAWSSVTSGVSNAFNTVKSTISTALSAASSAVTTAISGIVTTVAGLPGRVVSALGNLSSSLTGAGANLVRGFINGMTGAIAGVAATARNMAQQAISAATSALKIASPSRVFTEIGAQTGAGLIVGMDGMQRAVGVSGSALAAAAVPGVPAFVTRASSALTNVGGPQQMQSQPATFHLYDSSRKLIGTMRGIAQTEIGVDRRRMLESVDPAGRII